MFAAFLAAYVLKRIVVTIFPNDQHFREVHRLPLRTGGFTSLLFVVVLARFDL